MQAIYTFGNVFLFWMIKFSNYIFCVDKDMLFAFYASYICVWKRICVQFSDLCMK